MSFQYWSIVDNPISNVVCDLGLLAINFMVLEFFLKVWKSIVDMLQVSKYFFKVVCNW